MENYSHLSHSIPLIKTAILYLLVLDLMENLSHRELVSTESLFQTITSTLLDQMEKPFHVESLPTDNLLDPVPIFLLELMEKPFLQVSIRMASLFLLVSLQTEKPSTLEHSTL
jgi:hypothetical protein